MKKLLVLTLCAMMVLSFAACNSEVQQNGKDGSSEVITTGTTFGGNNAQIPNPLVRYESIDEASKAAGFTITEPGNIPEGFKRSEILVINNELVAINYLNGENEIIFRIAKGNDDISGDYNEYSENNIVNVGGVTVTMKGNHGMVNVAVWTNNDYTFAILINNGGNGIQSSAVADMIGNIEQ